MKDDSSNFYKSITKLFFSLSLQPFNRFFFNIILLPVLLNEWGSDEFGIIFSIIALAGILNFLSISYFSYFSNELLLKYKNKKNSYEYFNNFSHYFFKKSLILYIGYYFLFLTINQLNLFNSKIFISEEIKIIFLLCLINFFISNQVQSIFAGFRYIKKLYIQISYNNLILFIFYLIIFIVSLFYQLSPILYLLFLILVNLINYISGFFFLRIYSFKIKFFKTKKIVFKITDVFNKIKDFIKKDFSDYLILDFTIVLITYTQSPQIVSVYIFHRVMAKTLTLLSNLLSVTFKNEAAIFYKTKNFKKLKLLLKKIIKIYFILSILIFVIFAFIGNEIFLIWSKDEIEFSFFLFLSIYLFTGFENLWNISSSIDFGTNKHKKISDLYFKFTIFSLIIFYFLINFITLEIALLIITLQFILLFIKSYKKLII